jgi:branched-chain amino acid transport system substrate-binding protein
MAMGFFTFRCFVDISMKSLVIAIAFFFLGTFTQIASAAEPPTSDLVVGQVASLSGANGADLGLGLKTGIEICFKEVNERGGIRGRKLRLISKDDQYKPDETVRLTRELITADAPIALVGYRGTANTLALIKSEVLVKSETPLVGTLTGAAEVQGAPMIFHARTSYRNEITQLVSQLNTQGIKSIGVLYVDDAFGKSGLEAVQAALGANKLTPVVIAGYDKSADKVNASIKQAVAVIAKATPQAVVMVAVGDPVYIFVKELRAAASAIGIYGISVVNPDLVVEKVGAVQAHGIGFSQVFPFPYSDSVALIKEYRNMLGKHAPKAQPSYFSLEGYIYAKMLVEAIRKSGANVTRAKLLQTLQTLPNMDLGGFMIKMDPATRNGSNFTELTIIGKKGKLIR